MNTQMKPTRTQVWSVIKPLDALNKDRKVMENRIAAEFGLTINEASWAVTDCFNHLYGYPNPEPLESHSFEELKNYKTESGAAFPIRAFHTFYRGHSEDSSRDTWRVWAQAPKCWYSVLIGDFYSEEEANAAIARAESR